MKPPIAGVQEHWLAILRFDTEADSLDRQKLLRRGGAVLVFWRLF